MNNHSRTLFWQLPVEPEGCGSTKWVQNHDVGRILEDLIPDYDAELMVSKGEAVAIDPHGYCLTAKGFKKFMATAQQKGDSEATEILKDWIKRVHLYTQEEWREISQSRG